MKKLIVAIALLGLYLIGNGYCRSKGAGWLEYNDGLACGYYLAGEKKSVTVDFLMEREKRDADFAACVAFYRNEYKCDPRYIPPADDYDVGDI
jgi:hypothetical protein